ncbi:hypothetical protein C5167_049744 [Papaver somniferum]|uniref:Uncharacterized protein n=1 Tax=Papaver somniferum TaxID=3469 RepID=A0A4Y7KPJ8_PAPSO|nr:hypothetical protein C5167_049744 [Papaver somniferum]
MTTTKRIAVPLAILLFLTIGFIPLYSEGRADLPRNINNNIDITRVGKCIETACGNPNDQFRCYCCNIGTPTCAFTLGDCKSSCHT